MAEYSYYRAQGRSLAVIKEVVEAREKIEEINKKLSRLYGAYDFAYWPASDGFKEHITFVYRKSEDVPGNMDIDSIQTSHDTGAEEAVFCSVKPGTADEFNVRSMTGLIDRFMKRVRPENIFECGDMPVKKLPAGNYSMAFVRSKTVVGEFRSYVAPDWKLQGMIRGAMAICGGSGSAMTATDPIDWAKLDGKWYIRVPNDQGGNPVFRPPDAVSMNLEKMFELDRIEWALQRGYKPVRGKKPSGP